MRVGEWSIMHISRLYMAESEEMLQRRLMSRSHKVVDPWSRLRSFLVRIRVLNLLVAVLVILVTLGYRQSPPARTSESARMSMGPQNLRRRVIGYLVPWDQEPGFQTIKTHYSEFTEITPFWYRLDSSGKINYFGDNSYEDPEIIAFLRQKGIRITPAIANIYEEVWDAAAVSNIINNTTTTDEHIKDIVALVTSKDYDGIDIDYEALYDNDRAAFSAFIKRLSMALHNENKTLSVTVYAKTSEPGHSGGPSAQDWKAIGEVVDQVRVMVYDYHWSTSGPGPIAPINWAKQVAAFAVTKIPKEKLILGFALYGYDWVGNKGEPTTWQELTQRASRYKATVNWDEDSMSPWFKYIDAENVQHTSWFEVARSIDLKLEIVNQYQLSGSHFWRLGGEDPQVWQSVHSKFVVIGPTPKYINYLPFIRKQ